MAWGATILDRSQDHSHDYMWTIIRRLKAMHSRAHTYFPAPCHTGARLLAGITLHVSFPAPNHTSHNPEMVMGNARLYKGELAAPSRYTSLFTTLLTHTLQFRYWLEPWTANVPKGYLRFTAKTCRHRTGSRYRSPEHSLPPLRLNRPHQTNQWLMWFLMMNFVLLVCV